MELIFVNDLILFCDSDFEVVGNEVIAEAQGDDMQWYNVYWDKDVLNQYKYMSEWPEPKRIEKVC